MPIDWVLPVVFKFLMNPASFFVILILLAMHSRTVYIRICQTLAGLLLLFLAVSTFIPQIAEFPAGQYPGPANRLIGLLQLDRFYNSPVDIVLWGLLVAAMIGAVIFNVVRTPVQKILHLLLALCFVLVALEKGSNRRFGMTLSEGQEIVFSDYSGTVSPKHNVRLKLLRFEIQRHADESTPKAFISHLLINGQDTVLLAVNKPFAIDRYRLYQSAYDQKYIFAINIDDSLHMLSFGDSLALSDGTFVLENFDHQKRQFRLRFGQEYYSISMQKPLRIGSHEITVTPGGARYDSIIDVAEVRWTKPLLLASLLFIVFLGGAFWYRKRLD